MNGRKDEGNCFVCVCEQKTACACWMGKDQHCMILMNALTPLWCTLGRTDSVTLFGIDVIVTRRSGF